MNSTPAHAWLTALLAQSSLSPPANWSDKLQQTALPDRREVNPGVTSHAALVQALLLAQSTAQALPLPLIPPRKPQVKQCRRPSLPTRQLSDREIFILFVKILIGCLERTESRAFCNRVRAIVSECTKRNRLGDASYTPLQEAIEARLRRVVGERHWSKAKTHCDLYCRKRGLLPIAAV